ncbi:MAG TPA: rhodanese-like domain-containing protein [Candidatus Baltobacteraceae bacterium]|nr:rhodanese-like domain-containing protein [Candidatus Baltobacteraceae bacterium]
MSLVFKTIQTEGIAELSYLLGDDDEGIGAIFDPRADVDVYVEMAREAGLAITHIFETHIHADLVSGSRELRARLESAKIFVSHEGGAFYGFEHEKVKDGDCFTFGEVLVTARHTPGHTPEHLSYLLAEADHPDTPWGILTGDSLFVSSAGRPDLLGADHTNELAEKQFRTLRDFYLNLPDHVMIYPNHGAGSPCGADIGDRLSSTIGYERRFNKFLQFDDVKKFTDYALTSAPPVPKYYPVMKKINAKGPEILGNLPSVPALPPNAFKEAIDKKAGVLVDTRTMLAFGGGHIPGAFNIAGSPILSIWAGWMLDPNEPILLVLENENDLVEIVRLFIRTGYTKFAGYLVGGMKAWDAAGFPLEKIGQMSVHELNERKSSLQILDVRSPGEWKRGHVPGARHIFLPELTKRVGELDRAKPTAVYCGSGYRASIATSILKSEGFNELWNVPGSWEAWKKARFPVEGADGK